MTQVCRNELAAQLRDGILKSRTSTRGFTLIELMITVAVIGILAAIAYPSYQSAIVKNRRASAQAHLMDIAQREQQYLMDNRSYTDSLTDLNVTTPTDVSSYYSITVPIGTGAVPSFTATATPIVGSSQASDGTLTLTNTGVKSPSANW